MIYRVYYIPNQGPKKGKRIHVDIEGKDIEHVKAQFHRTSEILRTGGVKDYDAVIKAVVPQEEEKKS